MRSAVRWLPWPRDRCPTGRGCWSWAEEPLTVAAAEQEGEAVQASRSWRNPCLACVQTALNSRCPVPPDARSACRSGRSVSEGGRHLSASAGPPIRSGIEKRLGVAGSSLPAVGRHDAEPLRVKKGSPRMAGKNAKAESGGFSAEERAAMKERAAELRAEGKKGAKKADGLQAVLDKIAEMAPEDRAHAERVHVTVTATAPELSPKTWYGIPAYTNADGKDAVFFQDAGKFNYRYSTLGFQEAANLDDGAMWPVSYALQKGSPVVEKRVTGLVKAAIS